jgi:hypothetical protein
MVRLRVVEATDLYLDDDERRWASGLGRVGRPGASG